MKNPAWWKWFEIGLFISTIAAHLFIALSPNRTVLNWFLNDDAFYYFKVAQNITSGHGVTFDGINITNGFHPLWMLINIPVFWLAQFNIYLPLRLLIIVSSLLSAGTGILIFRFLRHFILPEVSAATAVVWVFLPAVHKVVVANGLESNLSAFMIALLLYLSSRFLRVAPSRQSVIVLGLIAGLTVLARLDNIFIVLLVGLWVILQETTAFLRNNVPLDFGLFFMSGLLAYYFVYGVGLHYFEGAGTLPLLIGLAFIAKPTALAITGMYSYHPGKLSFSFFFRCLLATLVSSLVIGLGLKFSGSESGHLLKLLLVDGLITLAGILGIRLLLGFLYRVPEQSANTLLRIFSSAFWKHIFPKIMSYYLPLIGILVIYVGVNYSYAGTAMPVSGQVKRWWGELPHSFYGSPTVGERELIGLDINGGWSFFLSPVWSLNRMTGDSLKPEQLHYVILGFAGVVVVFWAIMILVQKLWFARVADSLLLLPWFTALYAQIFSYTATSYVHLREWYWVSEMLFVVVGIGLVLDFLCLMFKPFKLDMKAKRFVLVILCGYVLFSFASMLAHRYSYSPFPDDDNMLTTRFLEENTESGALVGMPGGGTTAYFISNRTVVNLDGLINSADYFTKLRTGKGAQFLEALGVDYVCCSQLALEHTDPYESMLDGHLEPLVEKDGMTLYRFHSIP